MVKKNFDCLHIIYYVNIRRRWLSTILQFDLAWTTSLVHIALNILGLGICLLILARKYKRQQQKPVWWKGLLVAVLGLIAFKFDMAFYERTIGIPLLPLGVWIAYFFLKHTSWSLYQGYAWRGFVINYVFLALTLISFPIHDGLYPKDQAGTYLADISHMEAVIIHPSADDVVVDATLFLSQVDLLTPTPIQSQQWHFDSRHNESAPYYGREKFPYQLLGVKPSWGSGLQTAVYLEYDLQGVLITTQERQVYFRSTAPLAERRVEE